jgi:hypothetical protein
MSTASPWNLPAEYERVLERALAMAPEGFGPADEGKARLLVYYTAIGWHIFPTHYLVDALRCSCGCADPTCRDRGKHPQPPNGLKAASKDPERVLAFHLQRPRFNWALRTREISGVDGLDVDPGHEGPSSLEGAPMWVKTPA